MSILKLTPRQNALEIIRFGSPERVMMSPPGHGLGYYGQNPTDTPGGEITNPRIGDRWVDMWGIGNHKEQDGVMAFPEVHPIPDPAALRSYAWPDPDDERICGKIYRDYQAAPEGTDWFSGGHRCLLWERAYKLVGMEDLMACFYTEPGFVKELFGRIMDFNLGIARHYLKLGVTSVGYSDDLGTQVGPLFGLNIFEEFFRPEYERFYSLYKSHGVIVGTHSCGRVDKFIDAWIGLGLDILNPVQATANDLDLVRSRTQGRIALHGGVSNVTITSGPIEAIRREVKQRLWQLGRAGGYFCSADQHMPWPREHWEALAEAVEEFGAYPLSPPEEGAG